jgi:hypothetical protein
MSKVDFFIVGAPKSGTTALYSYLSTHPDIFLPTHKEPNYFAEDYPNIGGRLKTFIEYEKLFSSHTKKIAGDGSVCYLASKTAPKAIKEYNPYAKIIIMLRNPVELFLSEHSQLLYSFYEDIEDPYQAWQMQSTRKNGHNIPDSCREPETLQYKKICKHGKNLKKYIDIFPSDSILTLFFDDFVISPQSVYRKTLQFLELNDDGRKDFPKVNEAKLHKRSRLAKWLISPPGIWGTVHAKVRRCIATTDSAFINSIESTARKLAARNSEKKSSLKFADNELKSILSELQDDIALLASLTEKDLFHWKSDTL